MTDWQMERLKPAMSPTQRQFIEQAKASGV
jgi:hypothetical protein